MPVEKIKKSVLSSEFAKNILATLVGILLVYAIVLLATIIRNNLRTFDTIGFAERQERTMTFDAEAKVTAVPDTGIITMGVIRNGATVAEVQKKSDETMQALVQKLKEFGIDSKDIQTTDYRIYPKFKYTPNKGEEADGYEVSQNVTVKIRDLSKASKALELASQLDINSVQGVNFVIDDPDSYRAKARDAALNKAYEKARELASNLGVRLVSVVSYNEYEAGSGSPYGGPIYAEKFGVGGGGAMPSIEKGSTDVTMHVSITYEIR